MEITARQELQSMISDMFKDANGSRPRSYYDWDNMTEQDMQAEVKALGKQIEQQLADEKVWNDEQEQVMEKRIQQVIDYGAGDRKTALRWMAESVVEDEHDYYDLDYLISLMGFNLNPQYRNKMKNQIQIAVAGFIGV